MHGFDHGFPAPCTQLMRHPHIDTAAHSDQEAGKQRDQKRCRTNRPQRPVVRKAPYHRYVTHIKQHFQHLGKYQRAAQEKQVLPDRTCCHFYCFCFLFSLHSPAKAFLLTESAFLCAFQAVFRPVSITILAGVDFVKRKSTRQEKPPPAECFYSLQL